jgi:hypothetical protein
MRTWLTATWAFIGVLSFASLAQACWIPRIHPIRVHQFLSLSRVTVGEEKARGLTTPPEKKKPAAFSITPSGLEDEIARRIQEWEKRGFGVKPPDMAGATQTITVKVGDRTVRIDVTVSGPDTSPPAGDLLKSMKEAFAGETSTAGEKEAARKALADVYRKLAGDVKSPTFPAGFDKTVEGVSSAFLKEAANINLGAVARTREVIRGHLMTAVPEPRTTPLTEAIRARFSRAFQEIAEALNSLN